MSEIPKRLNCTAIPIVEAILEVAFVVHDKATPCFFRTNYASMAWLIRSLNPRNEQFIEEESRLYLTLWLPTGRLLAYFDPKRPPSTGYLVCRNPDCEVEVALAA